MQIDVEWGGSKLLAAFMDVTTLLTGHPDGALGYRAALIRGTMENTAVHLSKAIKATKDKYRRELPSEKGPVKMPTEIDGKPVAVSLWCSDPDAFTAEETAILSVPVKLSFPVSFTYEELIAYREPVIDVSGNVAGWQGLRGTFWVHFSELIDPPVTPTV